MRPDNPPPPVYPFQYREQPRSGNEINGLNDPARKRATPVFHSTGRGGGRQPLAWEALDNFFNLVASPACMWQVVRTLWQRRGYAGPVADTQVTVDDPAVMSEQVKAKALELGAGLAGVSVIDDDALYDGYPAPPYRYAISLGIPMDREEMLHVPQQRAAVEVMRTYRRAGRIAIELAAWIRSLGWPAQAYADGEDVLQIPMALKAGLGQLGKHGSMISKKFGSNFRLAAVMTDLPLALDAPVDIGVDDLCLNCQRCTKDCPPDAILDTKQLVRGVEKWYVDFDRCIPYFSMTEGCGICIEVCPWSEPGRGPRLSEKLLAKRSS
ncbi:MAG: reductive dehalogenase domain-containing protein [Gammaproteobacteria bacterium]|nr:reductive dehalogenase domain-containing protein [Gammaproteobacteria bacterium]